MSTEQSEYKSPNIEDVKRRLKLLADEWEKYYDQKYILQDILRCWPEDKEKKEVSCEP